MFIKWLSAMMMMLAFIAVFRGFDMTYMKNQFDRVKNSNISYLRLCFSTIYAPLNVWLLNNFYLENPNFTSHMTTQEEIFNVHKRAAHAFLEKELIMTYGNLVLVKELPELSPYSDLDDNCTILKDETHNCTNFPLFISFLTYNYKRSLISIMNVIRTVNKVSGTNKFQRQAFMSDKFIDKVTEMTYSLVG